ncbi:MAG: carboxymuconolactone decarboxylase family protein [Burkholderiaceae bacterium]|jgi:AhpD family alkylhydroperoxidase
MARLPYARLNDPTVAPLVDRITAERGSVLHLYQMLLHSPPLAEGWLAFLTAVRQKLDLPADLRELVIMRVAHLNGAPYEAAQHVPHALRAGITQPQLDDLADWAASPHYNAQQRAVLALCDAITRDIHFQDEILLAVQFELGERQTVELVATVAAYNMVSRFLEALGIHQDDPR